MSLEFRYSRAQYQQGNIIDLESFTGESRRRRLQGFVLQTPRLLVTRPPTERISLTFVAIKNRFGELILERELRVTVGEFRCRDFSHPQLVGTGLVPEPSGRRERFILPQKVGPERLVLRNNN